MLIRSFILKEKTLKFALGMPYLSIFWLVFLVSFVLGIFGLEFWKTIVIF